MTNKQKISALKKTRKVFDEIAKSEMTRSEIHSFLSGYYGICNHTHFAVLHGKSFNGDVSITDYYRKEFRIPMPYGEHGYKWAFTPKGYASRVKAIDKAIERLSK